MKLNILFLIPRIVSPTGGTEKQVIALLNSLDRKKYNIYLGLFKKPSFNLQKFIRNTEIINLEIAKILLPGSIIKVIKLLHEKRIHILHTFFVDGNIVGGIAGFFSPVKKVITTRRDMGFWYNPAYRLIFRIINLWTDLIIVNSREVKINTILNEHCPGRKVIVIPNIVNFSKIQILRDKQVPPHIEFIRKKHPVLIGIVSNLRPIKRINDFLYAAKILIDHFPEIGFIIIGDGNEQSNLQELAYRLEIQDHVYFLGKQMNVIPIINLLDVGVNSSESEGLSNAIIEYMACEKPVVATNVGGNVELVKNGETGFLIPPKDPTALAKKIAILIENKNLRISMGKNGYQRIQFEFSKSKIIKKYYNLYNLNI